jgi:hypothetical protein
MAQGISVHMHDAAAAHAHAAEEQQATASTAPNPNAPPTATSAFNSAMMTATAAAPKPATAVPTAATTTTTPPRPVDATPYDSKAQAGSFEAHYDKTSGQMYFDIHPPVGYTGGNIAVTPQMVTSGLGNYFAGLGTTAPTTPPVTPPVGGHDHGAGGDGHTHGTGATSNGYTSPVNYQMPDGSSWSYNPPALNKPPATGKTNDFSFQLPDGSKVTFTPPSTGYAPPTGYTPPPQAGGGAGCGAHGAPTTPAAPATPTAPTTPTIPATGGHSHGAATGFTPINYAPTGTNGYQAPTMGNVGQSSGQSISNIFDMIAGAVNYVSQNLKANQGTGGGLNFSGLGMTAMPNMGMGGMDMGGMGGAAAPGGHNHGAAPAAGGAAPGGHNHGAAPTAGMGGMAGMDHGAMGGAGHVHSTIKSLGPDQFTDKFMKNHASHYQGAGGTQMFDAHGSPDSAQAFASWVNDPNANSGNVSREGGRVVATVGVDTPMAGYRAAIDKVVAKNPDLKPGTEAFYNKVGREIQNLNNAKQLKAGLEQDGISTAGITDTMLHWTGATTINATGMTAKDAVEIRVHQASEKDAFNEFAQRDVNGDGVLDSVLVSRGDNGGGDPDNFNNGHNMGANATIFWDGRAGGAPKTEEEALSIVKMNDDDNKTGVLGSGRSVIDSIIADGSYKGAKDNGGKRAETNFANNMMAASSQKGSRKKGLKLAEA